MTTARFATASDFKKIASAIQGGLPSRGYGREVGMITEINASNIVANLKDVAIGEMCEIVDRTSGKFVRSQVISISDQAALLAPMEAIDGLKANAEVYTTGSRFQINVGEHLIGRVLNGLGQPIDYPDDETVKQRREVFPESVSPFDRLVIDETLETGVRAIDLMNTVGYGQRMAIMGAPGAGKSSLLGMLAKHTRCDHVVLAMIGERGRELREFLDRQLPPAVRNRCVTVTSTSDRPALERVMAAHTAFTIAEDLRARGNNVLMLFDSVTRFARALREIGLAAGENAVRMGFTPSVYAELPKLIERSGKTAKGSITSFFTVLLENEGINDPISEEVMSLTDGHLKLDTVLASAGQYPAIDILASKSRLMNEVAPDRLLYLANKARSLLAKFKEIELLVQVGEYTRGADSLGDLALDAFPKLRELLVQHANESVSFDHQQEQLEALFDELSRASEQQSAQTQEA